MSTWLIALVVCGPAGAGPEAAVGPRAIAESLLQRFPGSPPAALAAARIEHRSGSLDRALSLFGLALSLDPASFEAREARGDILSRKGRPAEAAGEYRQAASLSGEAPARVRLKRAMALLSLGECRRAEEELRESIGKFPGDSGLHYQLGQALLARGEAAGAVRELEEARRLGEPARAVEYALGQAHLLLGDRPSAEAALARFRALRTDASEREDARTQRDADRLKVERRNLALAHLDAAAVFRHHRLPAEARAHLEAALVDDPWFHAARVLLAELAVEAGDLPAACEEYERLLTAASDPGPLRKAASAVYQRRTRALLGDPAAASRRLADALAWARRAVELEPSAAAHETAAWASLAAGDRAAGLGHLREAARLDPGHGEYRRRLRELEEGSRGRR